MTILSFSSYLKVPSTSKATSIKIQLKAFYNATQIVRLPTSQASGMTKYWVSFPPSCLQIQYRSGTSIITLVMKTRRYTLNYTNLLLLRKANQLTQSQIKWQC